MSESNQPSMNELRAAHAENALRAGGVLYEVASSATSNDIELNPDEVADIIFPPRQPQEGYAARWELLKNAPKLIKESADSSSSDIFELAELLDIRRAESISDADISRINPMRAIWLVEGGANRTSIVRRELTFETMKRFYGEELEHQTVYQFGSSRPIPRERKDKETEKMVANAEYRVAQEIAPDYLPDDDSLTEFELNLATALQAGFEIMSDRAGDNDTAAIRITQLMRHGSPLLVLIEPSNRGGGLKDGLEAVFDAAGLSEGFQPVIATNGQYRAKDELQADSWARDKAIDILPPVAIGDEPGFTVQHNGKEIVTAERPPMVYVNEIVVLHRLTT